MREAACVSTVLISLMAGALPAAPLVSPEAAALLASPEPASPEMLATQDPAAITLLEQMATAHQGLETLEGRIVQRRRSEAFLEDIVSTGTFRVRRPDLLRFDYDESETVGRSTYFIRGDTCWAHIPELAQVEIYNLGEGGVGRSISRIMIGLDGAVDELQRSHWIRLLPPDPAETALGDSVAHLHFTPREGVDPEGFTSIDLWVNTQTLLPVQVKMVEETGDETTLTLTDLTLNPPLEDRIFDPQQNIPPGTEIVEVQ